MHAACRRSIKTPNDFAGHVRNGEDDRRSFFLGLARSSSALGYGGVSLLRAASRSRCWRACFLVRNASLRKYVISAPNGGFGAAKNASPWNPLPFWPSGCAGI